MTDERKIEERLKALEKKVAELEKALAERPTRDEVAATINFQGKNKAVRTASGRIR